MPIYCNSCGKGMQEGTQLCSNCGTKILHLSRPRREHSSSSPLSKDNDEPNAKQTRAGTLWLVGGAILLAAKRSGIFWVAMGAILLVATVGILRAPSEHSKSEASTSQSPDQQEHQADVAPTVRQTASSDDSQAVATSEQFQSAMDYAIKLQTTLEQQGEDVSVRVNHQHELTLTSDIFQDFSARESMANGLARDPKPFCNLGIWYIKVGYSKGTFSSDVMKTVALECTAAKAARLEETRPLREEIARAVNNPDGSGSIHAYINGSILVVESAQFFDDPQNGVTFAKSMAQQLLENPQKLCAASITQLQMKGAHKAVATVRVACN